MAGVVMQGKEAFAIALEKGFFGEAALFIEALRLKHFAREVIHLARAGDDALLEGNQRLFFAIGIVKLHRAIDEGHGVPVIQGTFVKHGEWRGLRLAIDAVKVLQHPMLFALLSVLSRLCRHALCQLHQIY